MTPDNQKNPALPKPQLDDDAALRWREIVQSTMEGAPFSTRSLEMVIDRMERRS